MVYVHMLCFNSIGMIQGALENFEATVDPDPSIVKVMFSCDYPIPGRGEHFVHLGGLAKKYGWAIKKIPNRGVADNWNQAFEFLGPQDDDVIIGFDPDCRLSPKGWLPAMVEVLRGQDEAVFVMPSRAHHKEQWVIDGHGLQIKEFRPGLRVTTFRSLIAWSMGGYRADWLRRVGSIKAHNQLYGYIEHWMYDRMLEYGKTFWALTDFFDDHQESPHLLYQRWKSESAAKVTTQKFEDWLGQRPSEKLE